MSNDGDSDTQRYKKKVWMFWRDINGPLDIRIKEHEAKKAADAGCQCDIKTKLVGDGCEHCNPELAAYYKETEE